MQGDKRVIDRLNAALSSELTAIVQYMTQSEICQNWGYRRLGDLTKARAIEEMKHAEGLIERIIFLDAIPSIEVALKPQLGSKVQEQLDIDLASFACRSNLSLCFGSQHPCSPKPQYGERRAEPCTAMRR